MNDNEINKVIAYNLKKIRNEKKLSLDEVAELTGVSKSMINRIETNKSTPSVTVLWKIADGLKVSFSALMYVEIESELLLEKSKLESIKDENYEVFNYIPYDSNRKFEVFYIEIDAKSSHISVSHDEAIEEYLFVVSGCVELESNETITQINEENMYKFDARKAHIYHNKEKKNAKALIIITYP